MKSVICVAAHPDDIEFSCTGSLKKHFLPGYDVVYIIITNGESGFKTGAPDRGERIRIRKSEQLEAAGKLGVNDVVFLDYRDGFLEYTDDLRENLVTLIRKYRPEIIFSFDPANQQYDDLNLFHRDHRIAAEAVFDACFAARNAWMYPGEPHQVGSLFLFGSHKPDHFVDISDVIGFKLSLLACYKSQFPDFRKVEKLIRECISGPHESFLHAESFRVLKIEQRT